MKTSKTLALAMLIAGSFLTGTALQAQNAPTNRPAGTQGVRAARGIQNIDQIATKLNLTDEQKTKLKAVLDDQQVKTKALSENTSLSSEDRRAKMKEIRDGVQAKFKEILTAEQFEKWQQPPLQRPSPAGGNGPRTGN